MDCHQQPKPFIDRHGKRRILLMGNPNVGKSVIFNRLTGLDVVSANYTGTTVTYHEGLIRHQGKQAVLIDVPGVYSLSATSKAEEVAVNMINDGADLIICVLDATHLERNLHLAFEVQRYGIPMIYVLNLSDVAKRRGIVIDAIILSKYLDAPVIETVAVKKIGIDQLKVALFESHPRKASLSIEDPDEKSAEIAKQTIKKHDVKPSYLEKLGDLAIKPFPGILIAMVVLALAILMVVGGGEALQDFILLPLLDNFYVPFISRFIESFVPAGMFQDILIGDFGVLIKMIEWPFTLILPYVLLFYIVFSFLEDSGYLPRLGVLMDGLFKKIGLSGSNIVPFIMGYGCAVPAILGTRTSSQKKQRIIVVSLIAIAVPCTAQTGAFIALLGSQSIFALVFVYMISFLTIFFTGVLLNKLLKGKSRPLILEIPNLLLPDIRTLGRKIWLKMKHFFYEAQVPMFIGILLASILVETGALQIFGTFMEPLVVRWLDLPKEASLSLILGIIRRELAVLPLLDMNLTTVQLITGSVVALFYLPCISVFVVLVKEFKLRIAATITLATFVFAFVFGGIIQLLLNLVL